MVETCEPFRAIWLVGRCLLPKGIVTRKVLGAYLVMFPNARVRVLVYNQVVALPALIVLGMWIALQVFSSVGSIVPTNQSTEQGGVAYMAHVGGFVAGLVLALLFRGGRKAFDT